MEIERQNNLFLNGPRTVLQTVDQDRILRESGNPQRDIVHMDPPDHPAYRAVTVDWFLPGSLKRLEGRLGELADRYLDHLVDRGGVCDFVSDVAAPFPLHVILSILGLPEADFPRMLKLTQELFGGADDELRRDRSPDAVMAVLQDFYEYFGTLTADRRNNPTNDLASVIANARIGEGPMPGVETLAYYVIVAAAGHDTTSSAIAGGLLALIEHPEQLARLRVEPAPMAAAVDEMIRWVTPVKHFMRTATCRYDLGGVEIGEGDGLLLSYASANRDEDVFEDPFRFDVGRSPNRHLAFGFGPHFCLGARLARMEMQIFFTRLLQRLDSIELAGPPALSKTLFVGGLKRLPIRYSLQ